MDKDRVSSAYGSVTVGRSRRGRGTAWAYVGLCPTRVGQTDIHPKVIRERLFKERSRE